MKKAEIRGSDEIEIGEQALLEEQRRAELSGKKQLAKELFEKRAALQWVLKRTNTLMIGW